MIRCGQNGRMLVTESLLGATDGRRVRAAVVRSHGFADDCTLLFASVHYARLDAKRSGAAGFWRRKNG